MYLNPLAEHLLDWFHIAMRITVMGQMNKGMREKESACLIQSVEKQLESLKHHLWNGNVGRAQTLIDVLKLQLEGESIRPERKKLLKAVQEFAGYIAANADFIPDYGDRYRNDETITTAFDLSDELLKSVPANRLGPGLAEVGVEYVDPFEGPAECHGAIAQGILTLRALRILQDLTRRGLPNLEIGVTLKMLRGNS
jgi:hypothetical protein